MALDSFEERLQRHRSPDARTRELLGRETKAEPSEGDPAPPEDSAQKIHTLRISNGILDHYPRMGEAIWLFLWLIDKTTREYAEGSRQVGIVLGGRPVPDQEIAEKFDCSPKTVRRWRNLLVEESYIEIERHGSGHSFKVMNAKKWRRNAVGTAIRALQANSAAVTK